MKIDNCLKEYDPSRFTVYQMLEYIGTINGTKIIQRFENDIYLLKTEPFIDSLYNMAHILKENISEHDFNVIMAFFGKNNFRIKLPENEKMNELLLMHGLKFKDAGSIMVKENILKETYIVFGDDNITIRQATNREILEDYKQIFCEAFKQDIDTVNRKFGFEDEIILNPEDCHINAFVLYENNVPASAGAYYAFDNFSIENIGTKNAFRGKGYANKIMQCLMNEAQKLKYKKVCLVASEAGAGVYKKMGFEVTLKTNTFIRD